MSSRLPRHRLKELLPRAGFVWQIGQELLSSSPRDRRVVRALTSVGIELRQEQVEAALAAMFDTAKEQQQQGALRAAETVPYFVAAVGRLVPFAAAGLEEAVFIDLFTTVRAARQEWHKNPRPPFDVGRHGALAHAIDAFEAAVGEEWNDTEVELFELAGGMSDAELGVDPMEVDAPAPGPMTSLLLQHAEKQRAERIPKLTRGMAALDLDDQDVDMA